MKKNLSHRLISKIVPPILIVLHKLFLLLPLPISYRIMDMLTILVILFGKKKMKNLTKNLKTAMPELSENELRNISRANMKHLGRSMVELLSYPKMDKKKIESLVEIEGVDILNKVRSEGKGAIILTAHFGNWELLGASLTKFGFPLKVVATKTHNAIVNDLLLKLRNSMGIEIIYREESIWKMLRVIKEKGFFAVLIDQDTKVDGVFADFFGLPTYTPKGPALIAMRTGAPIVPAFIVRKSDGKHKIFIDEPLTLVKTDNKEQDIETNTGKMNAVIEKYIRAYPDQWSLMQDRWRSEP